jgi:hypothetical protein
MVVAFMFDLLFLFEFFLFLPASRAEFLLGFIRSHPTFAVVTGHPAVPAAHPFGYLVLLQTAFADGLLTDRALPHAIITKIILAVVANVRLIGNCAAVIASFSTPSIQTDEG